MYRIFVLLAILAVFTPLAASQRGIRKPKLCSLAKGLNGAACGKKGDPIAVTNFCSELMLPRNLSADPVNAKLTRLGCGLVNQEQMVGAISSALSAIGGNSSQQAPGDTVFNINITQVAGNISNIAAAQAALELLVKDLSMALEKATEDLKTLDAVERADVAALKASLAQLSSQISGLNGTGDLTQILQTISQLNSTVSVLNATIFGALPPGSEVAKAIGALEKTVGELSAAITALAAKEAADVAKLTSALDALTATVNGITGGGAPLNISLTDIVSQLQQLSASLTALNSSVFGPTTLAGLSNTVQQLSSKLDALTATEASDVAAANAALAQLNSTIQSIQQKQSQADARLVNLGATTNTLNSTLATVQTTLTSLTNAISGLTGLGNLNGILGTLNSLNSTVQTLTGGLTTVSNNQTSIATDLLGLGQTVTGLTNTVNSLTGLTSPVVGIFDASSLSSFNLAGSGVTSPLLGGDSFSGASMTVQRVPTVSQPDLSLMTLRMKAAETIGLSNINTVTNLISLPTKFLNRNGGGTALGAFTLLSQGGANGFECPFTGDVVGRIVNGTGGVPSLQFARKGIISSLLSILDGAEFVCQFFALYPGTL